MQQFALCVRCVHGIPFCRAGSTCGAGQADSWACRPQTAFSASPSPLRRQNSVQAALRSSHRHNNDDFDVPTPNICPHHNSVYNRSVGDTALPGPVNTGLAIVR